MGNILFNAEDEQGHGRITTGEEHIHTEACKPQISHNVKEQKMDVSFQPGEPVDPEFTINIPGVICREILSYLSWPDKLNLIEVIPQWEDHLLSVAAWPLFNCSLLSRKDMEYIVQDANAKANQCIQKYGQYFQSVRGEFYFFDFSSVGLSLLQNIACCCKDLRSLRMDHPDTFKYGSVEVLYKLKEQLQGIVANCRNLTSITISFNAYLPLSKEEGFDEVLGHFTHFPERIKILDFAYGSGYDDGMITPNVHHLAQFTNLKVLKCPIQGLNTNVVCMLGGYKLRKLIVINNDTAIDDGFNEQHLNWGRIAKHAPNLRVHYIIVHRTFHPDDLFPNPLLCSITMDSLCNPVSKELIDRMCDLYADKLESWIHLANDWDNNSYANVEAVPDMYRSLACCNLNTLACGVRVPARAVLRFVAHCQHVKELWVLEDKVCFHPPKDTDIADLQKLQDWKGLQQAIRAIMEKNWSPCSKEEMDKNVNSIINV